MTGDATQLAVPPAATLARAARTHAPSEPTLGHVLSTGAIHCVYQPIVDLDSGEVIGFEALARGPSGTALERPDRLFAAAAREGCVPRLDEACRAAALAGAAAASMRLPWTLFVNVEPEVAGVSELVSHVTRWARQCAGAPPHQVVIELTERALTTRPAALLDLVAEIRSHGWGIAMDDVGADPKSLALLPLIRPDVIKLDLSLVQQQASAQVARIVTGVNAEAERSGSAVLAEGIETDEHLAVALALGATMGQGWLLGRPGALPAELPPLRRAIRLRGGRELAMSRTPYETVTARREPRTARKRLLIEISKHLERRAVESGESTVVLSTFQSGHSFTPRTRERYTELAACSAFVGALGLGMPLAPAPGVRGADLEPDDPLVGEWDIAVVGPHFAATLVARDLGDTGPDRERRFDFVLSHDRELSITVATELMARMPPEPTAPVVHPHVPGSRGVMKRIVYCSQATHDFSPDELVALLEVSRVNNERSGLSGMLLYSSQSFLQVLEGDPAALAETYQRIRADDRHASLRLLLETEVPAPLFPDWTMGFQHVDDDDLADELDGFTPETDYPLVNPDLVTNAGVALTLLKLYAKNRVR